MILGPKYKICKRLGSAVFEQCQTAKFKIAEERTQGTKRRGRKSDYGLQLIEKQKARFMYGLSEKQFSRYAFEAMEGRSNSAEALVARLESRLDNVVFRAGFVKTRRAARQLVSHGHVQVNGRRMNVPSHMMKVGDVVSVRPESRGSALFGTRAELALEIKTPEWLKLGPDNFSAEITAKPAALQSELPFATATIIQFYSR